MQNRSIVKHQFVVNYRARTFRTRGPLYYVLTLFVCEDNVPPEYKTSSGTFQRSLNLMVVVQLCEMSVNLRELPDGAFTRYTENKKQFYRATYELGLSFGAELIMSFLHQGDVIGSVAARYSL
jgi:hypothetical protein